MKQFLVLFLFLLMGACGSPDTTAIVQACVAEGGETAACGCMANGLKSRVDKQTFSTLISAAQADSADGMAKALLKMDDEKRMAAGLALGTGCNGEDLIYEKTSVEASESTAPHRVGTKLDLANLCTDRGYDSLVCHCWADKLKTDLSEDLFLTIASGSLSGDEGYANAINTMPEEDKLKVSFVLMDANDVCTALKKAE